MQGEPSDVTHSRDELQAAMGGPAVVDASAVIAMFNIMDRIADTTGIPIDEGIAHDSRLAIGKQLGMEHLAAEHRSAQ